MYKRKNYSVEFAKRTRIILKDNLSSDYEVTQLINSMVGLLIIPEQKEYNNIDDSYVSNDMLDKLKNHSIPSSVDFRTIIRRMRNAVSHSRLEFIGKAQKESGIMEIDKVCFRDVNPKNHNDTFEIELSVEELKDFLYEFTDSIIKRAKV